MLAIAAIVALVVSNSPWAPVYERFVQMRVELRFANDWLVLSKPWVLWVNDLWMTVFFFLVGLEVKREVLVGELASLKQALLPALAAIGGMVVPALIYLALNHTDPVALRGWAIPTATDIAFALGILMLLGSRVPPSLKIFLTAVAIIDDLGAIVVIALFYTAQLSGTMLAAAAVGGAVLFVLNRSRVSSIGPYVVVGLVVWVCVLKSGIHATLAGVATATAIPLRDKHGGSPLELPSTRCTPGSRSRCCRCSRSRMPASRCKACRWARCCRAFPWASRSGSCSARRSACSVARGC